MANLFKYKFDLFKYFASHNYIKKIVRSSSIRLSEYSEIQKLCIISCSCNFLTGQYRVKYLRKMYFVFFRHCGEFAF